MSAARYASPDAGALLAQVPASGDANGDLDAAEFAPVALRTSAAPLPGVVAARVDAWPSPFNARANLRITGLADGAATLDLHDAAGRRVRSLRARVSGGVGMVTWDGRDAAGRNVPSGVYFARVAGRDVPAARLVLVK